MSKFRNTHIIIGDAHCNPDVSNRRFKWLGNFLLDYIKANKEDEKIKVVEMGDWEDGGSLSNWDIGTMAFEGRRYAADVKHSLEARELAFGPVRDYLARCKYHKQLVPKVSLTSLGGNHWEERIKRFVQKNPQLEGTIHHMDAHPIDYGIPFTYSPFLEQIDIDGINYTHYWNSRNGRPLGGGKYPAAALLREKACSSVVGHSHVLDQAVFTTGDKRKFFSLVAGCFLDPEQREDYAKQSNDVWWKGIVVLRDVREGYPYGGVETIPIETLQRIYGDE